MKKALVVDDSRAIRGILARILIRNGFQVFEAGDGLEALAALDGDAATVDLLCVDYNMPGMNGLELLTEMREQPRFDDLHVVMVTTETNIEAIHYALSLGVSQYVMKPFTEAMITDKLKHFGLLST